MKNNSLYGKIAARYSNSIGVTKRKNITFNADEELLERLDNIVAAFNENDKITTRNAVIEDALLAYIEEAEDFIQDMILKEDKDNTGVDYDTAVFPAINENFNTIFIQQNKWMNIRMAEYRIQHVKYIALYRGTPFSAITHYAEVISISQPDKYNHRVIELKDPISLDNPIPLAGLNVSAVRRLFYTKLSSILAANTIKDLI